METSTRLLGELAAALGTDALTPNADALVGLTFDNHDVFLSWQDVGFLFCAPLEPPTGVETLEARLELCIALLRRNHLTVGASHAVIGLAEDGQTPTLSAFWTATEHDDAVTLGEALLGFVEDLKTLARELADWNTLEPGPEEKPREAAPVDVIPSRFV